MLSWLPAWAMDVGAAGVALAGALAVWRVSGRALAAAAVLVLALTHWSAWRVSAALVEARYAAEALREEEARAALRRALAEAEARRLEAQAERDVLERELEDAARRDPNAGRISLGADSVRRLNRR